MKEFKVVKRSIWLPLVTALLLCGCFFFDDDERHSSTDMVGFASDTTAILFTYDWTTSSCSGSFFPCAADDYHDLELKLVDTRFHKVYWKSKIKNDYAKHFRTRQWNDSTIVIDVIDYYQLLWTIGLSKPQKITLNWNTEKGDSDIFSYNYNWLRWKDDSIIVVKNSIVVKKFIIDTKTKTVNSRNVALAEEELLKKGAVWNGERFIYLENECKSEKCPETLELCKAFVISGNGDTLHIVGHYPYIENQESFDKRCEFGLSFGGNLISIRTINVTSLPSNLLPKDTGNILNIPALAAMVFIDKNKKELQNPSFWYNPGFWYNFSLWYGNIARFVDSTGNITEY